MKTETERLKKSIFVGAGALKPHIPWADTVALLGAIAELESSFGVHNQPRYEKAFAPGGAYFTKEQRERFMGVEGPGWGAWAACSYSSFQIMYTVACEFGFDTDPWHRNPYQLFNDETAIYFVVEFIKKRVIERDNVQNVTQLGIVYNGGSLSTQNPAAIDYGNRLAVAYETVVARRGLFLNEGVMNV